MNFKTNLKAYLITLPLKRLSGQQKFLAVAAHSVSGSTSAEVEISNIRNSWPKSLLKISYNPSAYDRAQRSGWVNATKQGNFLVTEDGLQHLAALIESADTNTVSSNGSGLYIFEKKSTHSFDKFIRGIFANAKTKVYIADSYVDETIFDNVLDLIPKILDIKLMYGQKKGAFDSRISRFAKEYPKFIVKRFKDLHDRFIVADNIGYILGPSIKDAASKSPALVVSLDAKSSIKLINFFESLWAKSK